MSFIFIIRLFKYELVSVMNVHPAFHASTDNELYGFDEDSQGVTVDMYRSTDQWGLQGAEQPVTRPALSPS